MGKLNKFMATSHQPDMGRLLNSMAFKKKPKFLFTEKKQPHSPATHFAGETDPKIMAISKVELCRTCMTHGSS